MPGEHSDQNESVDRADLLISKVIDGEATGAEYEELKSLAAVESSVWRDMAEGQRVSSAVESEIDRAIAVASRVEAPVHEHDSVRVGSRLSMVGGAAWRGAGWVAAAAVTLAWTTTGGPSVGSLPPPPGGNSSGFQGGVVPVANASAALERYLDLGKQEGQVIGEMPTGVVLERRPTEDGKGYEVIFLRQIMERAVVEDVYEIARDEAGNAAPVRVAAPDTAGVH